MIRPVRPEVERTVALAIGRALQHPLALDPVEATMTEPARALYRALRAKCDGHFRLVTYLTDQLRAREVLPLLPVPLRPPGLVVGWVADVVAQRVFRPVHLDGTQPIVEERVPWPGVGGHYEWATIVEPARRDEAILAVLRRAHDIIHLLALRATGQGAYV